MGQEGGQSGPPAYFGTLMVGLARQQPGLKCRGRSCTSFMVTVTKHTVYRYLYTDNNTIVLQVAIILGQSPTGRSRLLPSHLGCQARCVFPGTPRYLGLCAKPSTYPFVLPSPRHTWIIFSYSTTFHAWGAVMSYVFGLSRGLTRTLP